MRLGLEAPHSINHQLHIFGVGIGCNTVTEVEDVWAIFEGINDLAGLTDEVIAACDHVGRLEVALHAAACLHVGSGPLSCDAIVERDTVCADGLMEADIALACTTGEGDDGGVWVQSFQRSSDLRRRALPRS